MPVPKHEYLSEVWKDGIFGIHSKRNYDNFANEIIPANKVVLCTGGAGSICSAQVSGFNNYK
jgi:peroxisomal 2,4-dienoyl-CoA reductase